MHIYLGNFDMKLRDARSQILSKGLDGKPLAQSGKILIQAVTEERPYGFRTQGDRITNLGGRPMGVRKIDARVALRLRGEGRAKVMALDENGYATRAVAVEGGQAGEPLVVTLSEDAIYHVVTR